MSPPLPSIALCTDPNLVVTMGSPMLAPGAHHMSLTRSVDLLVRLNRAGMRNLMAEDCVAGHCAQESFAQARADLPPDVDFTAIYSRRDGIVDWRACLDPDAHQVEVRTSHCGMAVDPVVMDHVLTALRDQQVRRANQEAAPSAEVGSLRVARR